MRRCQFMGLWRLRTLQMSRVIAPNTIISLRSSQKDLYGTDYDQLEEIRPIRREQFWPQAKTSSIGAIRFQWKIYNEVKNNKFGNFTSVSNARFLPTLLVEAASYTSWVLGFEDTSCKFKRSSQCETSVSNGMTVQRDRGGRSETKHP